MGLFRRRKAATEILKMEVPVLPEPRRGESFKLVNLDDEALERALQELRIEVESGQHTPEDDTLVVLQRVSPQRVTVTMGSEILGDVPEDQAGRVAERLRHVAKIAAAPARVYRYSGSRWSVVVFA
ncbi:hypothetical protein [Actinomyces polynesiensis]|uniref:hypothetical protein n=1 Tax=Actinomyces polynesiensis TaxID=1325934 RepID=UPI0011C6FF9E|nr:hypothetical protein [Actinomyces polynesiensis]